MPPEFLRDHSRWPESTAMTVTAVARGQATSWIARVVTAQALGLPSGGTGPRTPWDDRPRPGADVTPGGTPPPAR